MQKLHTSLIRLLFLGSIVALIFASTPAFASTDQSDPICLLATIASGKAVVVQGENNEMLLSEGSSFHVIWAGGNAITAVDGNRNSIPHVGLALLSPKKTTTYSYTFSAGSHRVTCSMKVNVISGSINTSSLKTDESRPTLSGKVSGLTTLRLEIFESGDSDALYTDDSVDVRNGKWEAKISKKLPDGIYNVVLLGDEKFSFNTVATGTLAIGDATEDTKSNTTLVVETIPLLSGGIAHKGSAVSISYLQVTNIGKETATVNGFYLKQNGSASTDAVIGLTTVDDKGGSRGSVGGTENDSPFKNRTAFVPTHATILAGQMLLFTIKAVTTNNISQHAGTQLKIDVTGVEANSTVSGVFPIRGTTWTLAN